MKKYPLVVLSIGLICIGAWAVRSGSSSDVELKFSHKLHVIDNQFECNTCHTTVDSSKSGSDNLLPNMDICATCHDVSDDQTCNLCHSDLENPRIVPRIEKYNQKFPHNKHLKAGLECQSCHAAVAKQETVLPVLLPTMPECIDCHESRAVVTTCITCHTQEESGKKPMSHTPNFIHSHSDLAQNGVINVLGNKKCALCHQPEYCQDCHEGENLDRRTHPLNFEFTHALAAEGKEHQCFACHTEHQFCIDCHRDRQIMPHNHIAGWVNRIPDDGGRHRVEAESDLESCMACHEQNAEQICQPCHGK